MRKLNTTPKTTITTNIPQAAKILPPTNAIPRPMRPSDEIPKGTSDIILTVANFGYMEMLINFCKSLQQVNPDSIKNLLVLTFDPKLITELNAQGYDWIPVKYVEYLYQDRLITSEAVTFGTSYWNLVTRFKLLAIWLCLKSGKRDVYYYDPDIVFIRDPLSSEAVAQFKTDIRSRVWIQQGRPYCSGVIFASSELSLHSHLNLFDPESWRESRFNDEEYLTKESAKRSVEFGVLDFGLYPNGLVWYPDVKGGISKARKMISDGSCVLMHFNFISTPELKIKRMKELGVFYL